MFDHPDYDDHQQVLFARDVSSGLHAIIAIHGRGSLGGGGCRMWAYERTDDAVRDVLRLSKAMSWKLALAGIDVAGAKAVILGDPMRDKSEALLRAFGRVVDQLGGRYIAAEDVGTGPNDLAMIGRETMWVSPGDTSEATAYGVFVGVQVALRHRLGYESLRGVRVALQGAGRIGATFGRLLADAGAELILTDIDIPRARAVADELGAAVVDPAHIYEQQVDVFSPCALGATLNASTIPRLRCPLVAGGANNQLDDEALAEELASRQILFAPDFIMNAGGVLASAAQTPDVDPQQPLQAAGRVGDLLEQVLVRAEREQVTPWRAAVALAREKMG